MAPTSEERREVALKMRDAAANYNNGNILNALIGFCGIEFGGKKTLWKATFTMLADLIDPTCHVIPGKEAVAELKDGTRLTGVLLSCGHAVFGVSAKDMPRFCCECGARITNEVGDD